MNFKKIINTFGFSPYIFLILLLSGCSTGIESTKTITYSKSERKELTASPEEVFMAGMVPTKLKDWKKGKRFMISDNRAALVLESNSRVWEDSVNIKGKEIMFNRILERPTPGGEHQVVIAFTDGVNEYLYPTGKRINEALENLSSLDIPMLIDLDLVDEYRNKL
ncbi:MAG: hypothetical protein K2K81_08360 [Muribaculaceae bacterium]|nr:hypothetical protein [Muribaculaceae bacterium]